MRRHLAQVLRHGIGRLGEIDDMHRGDVIVATAEPLGDVAQRKEIERFVGFGDRKIDVA